jgi:hypothetical protein
MQYLPTKPNQLQLQRSDLNNIINQLLKPYIITGDFNSQSPYCGSEKIDQRGKSIEKIKKSKMTTSYY